jgi:hypothetical protein
MPTTKQLAANRRNAQKSTGPRTTDGKSVSRFNALKFGIHAESILLPEEDPVELDQLIDEYQHRYQPQSPEHRFLIKSLCTADWFVDRLYRAEAHVWRRSSLSDFNHTVVPPWEKAGAFVYDFYPKLRRAHAVLHRTYLDTLREIRAQGIEPEISTTQPTDSDSETPQMGSFCQTPVALRIAPAPEPSADPPLPNDPPAEPDARLPVPIRSED